MTDSKQSRQHKPELMSPAGHWDELHAAINAGADAVYFGLQHFTARAKVGFSLSELPSALATLHRHAVKGFITLNTLVFDHELDQAVEAITAVAQAGADAIIVQDIAMVELARKIAPDLDIHGSTQMSITTAEGADLAAALGCRRVVLGRELSLKDIRKIAAATDVELEVFVHGALCVSYSGQCFSSEAWGGRSANRGQCAQACRLSYDLIVDDAKVDLGPYRYLLSPGDLYAIEQIPELIEIGIACCKIEGRYKGPEYVALTTAAYRQAIDAHFCTQDRKQSPNALPVEKAELEQIYSRGLQPSFISGINHQMVVTGRAPRHRGQRLGTVTAVEKTAVVIQTESKIKAGDGVVFDSAAWRSPDEPEEGGNIFSVDPLDANQYRLRFGTRKINFQRIRVGDLVWRTRDPNVTKRAGQIASQPPPTTGIDFIVKATPGQPLKITGRCEQHHAEFVSESPLTVAKKHSLSEESLTQQLSRLGGTPFHLQSVDWQADQAVFCPVSLLNQARREIVSALIDFRENAPHSTTSIELDSRTLASKLNSERINEIAPQLHLLVRNADQLDAAIECRPASITLDYLELYGLRPSVEKIQEASIVARVASPRILKPAEQKIVRFLLSLNCSLLIRSSGLLNDLITNEKYRNQLPDLHGDFSFNVTNWIAAEAYFALGLSRLTAAYDLNAVQISELCQRFGPTKMEVVAFQHLPVFHTEHCVFCRFLSAGTDSTNCGHPCESHQVNLQDSAGNQHPVLADIGCRNTVFNARAQFTANAISSWLRHEIKHFRLEFVQQTGQQVIDITTAIDDFLQDKIECDELKRRVEQNCHRGTTDGSLFVPKNFKQLVQLS